MDFNVVPLQNLSTDVRNVKVNPELYKKYIPNPEFNFFLSSLRRNAIIIILVVIDSLWFAFRCTRTYARVVLLLHGFKHEIDVDEDDNKPKKKEGELRVVTDHVFHKLHQTISNYKIYCVKIVLIVYLLLSITREIVFNN